MTGAPSVAVHLPRPPVGAKAGAYWVLTNRAPRPRIVRVLGVSWDGWAELDPVTPGRRSAISYTGLTRRYRHCPAGLAVVCASLSQSDDIAAASDLLTRGGWAVLAPVPDPRRTPEQHNADWLRAIEHADLVYVIPKSDGSLGEQVGREWTRAGVLDRPVRWHPREATA